MMVIITGIEKYYFLFALALVYCVFAVVQDFKRNEVANWLNFSLAGFALVYRGFYSAYSGEWSFLLLGLLGFVIFFVIGNALYYSNVVGGGDAKLLMGIGAILPIGSLGEAFYVIFGFLLMLFSIGAVYSLGYSVFIAGRNWKEFKVEFRKNLHKRRGLFYVALIFILLWVIFGMMIFGFSGVIIFGAAFIAVLPFLFVYLFSLDKCTIRLIKPNKLMEGDWIIKGMQVKGYYVRKTVHGLTLEDIKHLKRANKSILVRGGIPFTPVFLISLAIMVFFYAIGWSYLQLLGLLF